MSKTFEQNENINAMAEQAVVHLIESIFDKIVYIDPTVVRYNIGLACNGGMSKLDRSMRLERANYLMSHFAHIFVGLVISPDFRDAFETAVRAEISIDGVSDAECEEIRKQMYIAPKKPSKGAYVIDFSTYNDKYFKLVSAKLFESFNKFVDYDDAIDQAQAMLTVHERLSIGFCISNFTYLYRAFSRNDIFMDYVKTVVSSVNKQLGI